MHPLKEHIYQLCLASLDERLSAAKKALEEIREASHSETKSSAGDKYETGRAMAQIEIERNLTQVEELRQLRNLLLSLEGKPASPVSQLGSLVITSIGNYYLSVPAGQWELNGATCFAISAKSPVGAMLVGKREGEAVQFRDKHFLITAIF